MQRPLTFTLRTLLLITVIIAVVFATWRLGRSADILFFVGACELGAATGIFCATYSRRKNFVSRGILGGAVGGGIGLVSSFFWPLEWWAVFVELHRAEDFMSFAVFVLLWGAIGSVCGAAFGLLNTSLILVFGVKMGPAKRDHLIEGTRTYVNVQSFLRSL